MATRKAVYLATGSLAVAGAVVGVNATEFLESSGSAASEAMRVFRSFGGVTILVAIALIALRAGAFKLVMIPDNMSGVLCRRGRLVKHRKTGEMIWYESGKVRVHVSLYRQIVLIHHGERYTPLGTRSFNVSGDTWEADFTAIWKIPKDAEAVERSLTIVSDRNWWDGEFNQLDNAVKEQSIGLLSGLIAYIPGSAEPTIDRASIRATDCLAERGAKYVNILNSPFYRPGDQLQKDGLTEIAQAITVQAEQSAPH